MPRTLLVASLALLIAACLSLKNFGLPVVFFGVFLWVIAGGALGLAVQYVLSKTDVWTRLNPHMPRMGVVWAYVAVNFAIIWLRYCSIDFLRMLHDSSNSDW